MYDIDYSAIGQKLQLLRREKGITQEFIATGLDVTVGYISNVENSKVKMNLRVLSYYANLLGVSIDYLIHTESTSNTATPNMLDTEIFKLIQNFTDSEKEKLIRILRVMNE